MGELIAQLQQIEREHQAQAGIPSSGDIPSTEIPGAGEPATGGTAVPGVPGGAGPVVLGDPTGVETIVSGLPLFNKALRDLFSRIMLFTLQGTAAQAGVPLETIFGTQTPTTTTQAIPGQTPGTAGGAGGTGGTGGGEAGTGEQIPGGGPNPEDETNTVNAPVPPEDTVSAAPGQGPAGDAPIADPGPIRNSEGAETTISAPAPGVFAGGTPGFDETKGSDEQLTISAADQTFGDLATGNAQGPQVLGEVAAGLGILQGVRSLLGGNDTEFRPGTTGGQGGSQVAPLFPDINQQQLQSFLQMLAALRQQRPAPVGQGTALSPQQLSTVAPPPIDAAPNPDVPGAEPAPDPFVPPPDIDITPTDPVAGPEPSEPPPDIDATPAPTPTPTTTGTETGIEGTVGEPITDFTQLIPTLAEAFSLPTFDQPFVTPATDLQRQALGSASEFLAADPTASQQQAEATLNELLSTGGRFDLTPEFEALEAINKRRLAEESANLNELFGTLGARFGSDIALGQADLRSRFLEQGAAQRAQLQREAFENAQQRRLTALPLTNQLRNQQLSELLNIFQLGEAERGIADVGTQRQLAEHARTQGALLPLLLNFLTAGVEGDVVIPSPVEV